MSKSAENIALIDHDALAADLDAVGLTDWAGALTPLLEMRLSAANHGDFKRWCAALASIDKSQTSPAQLKTALLELSPWRKGPFDLGGVHIDSEWRSDHKWARIADRIQPLDGRNVLDVGCGNGYYALRMRAAGANSVCSTSCNFWRHNASTKHHGYMYCPCGCTNSRPPRGVLTRSSQWVCCITSARPSTICENCVTRCDPVASWYLKRCTCRVPKRSPVHLLIATRA